MRKHLFITALLAALASATACKKSSDAAKPPPAADNTERNARTGVPTADNAVETRADLDITQKIRKAIVDDSSLSTDAHNVKIVVKDGSVTLVGPVASEAERDKIEQIATNAVGRSVSNQLEVTN
jgi:osmotically-inducible protein OsmY